MTKTLLTHIIAVSLICIAYFTTGTLQSALFATGLFALAGSLTNWLAVHMLFEKIPGLYGSGVISARFDDFKLGLQQLIMEQFFSRDKLDRFFDDMVIDPSESLLDFSDVIEQTDLSPAFQSLVDTIQASSFGGMLAMVGGEAAIEPLRDPFIDKMKVALNDIAHSPSFQQSVRSKLHSQPINEELFHQVEHVVNARLDELTPQMVKDIIQTMIRQHLGWLVVWGGVFGGLIGLISSQLGLVSTIF